MSTLIKQAAELIKNATSIIALTGAGISTPSGIPDFRSPGSGVWGKVNPMQVASIMAFRKNPKVFYDWIHPLAKKVLEATPNPAHYALAKLEEIGKLNAIITQNIDGLHQAANSKTVFEVHGHIREAICMQCYKIYNAKMVMQEFLANGNVPHCDCGGVLKPNTILFGEQLPMETLLKAKTAADDADLMIIAGSSLEVAPISYLPDEAVQRGTKLIIVNFDKTHIDNQAEVVINDEVAEILPQIVELVAVS